MTRSSSGLLLGAAILLNVTAALAAEDLTTANHMLPTCQEYLRHRQPLTGEQGYCAGVVDGIVFIGRKLNSSLKIAPISLDDSNARITWLHCLNVSGKATLGQMVRVVTAYIEARSARMHEMFHDLALEALHAAWPCH